MTRSKTCTLIKWTLAAVLAVAGLCTCAGELAAAEDVWCSPAAVPSGGKVVLRAATVQDEDEAPAAAGKAAAEKLKKLMG